MNLKDIIKQAGIEEDEATEGLQMIGEVFGELMNMATKDEGVEILSEMGVELNEFEKKAMDKIPDNNVINKKANEVVLNILNSDIV